jgi:hypothetical protein
MDTDGINSLIKNALDLTDDLLDEDSAKHVGLKIAQVLGISALKILGSMSIKLNDIANILDVPNNLKD